MDIKAKLAHIRNLINGKKEDNCPTSMLFYIANSIQCHDSDSVEPWYSKIKELSGGANKHFGDVHRAIIFGMYPELEDACKYFSDSMSAAREQSRNMSLETHRKIEQDTIKKFHLHDKYYIGQTTEAQKRQINANLSKVVTTHVNDEINSCNPATQLLAKSMRHAIPNDVASQMAFLSHFYRIDTCSKNEEAFNKFKSRYSSDTVHNTEELYKLKHQGIVDEEYNIKDYKAFKQSSLVQNFEYQGQTYNLEKHLMPEIEAKNLKKQFTWNVY